jgi:hypothetical protein
VELCTFWWYFVKIGRPTPLLIRNRIKTLGASQSFDLAVAKGKMGYMGNSGAFHHEEHEETRRFVFLLINRVFMRFFVVFFSFYADFTHFFAILSVLWWKTVEKTKPIADKPLF